MSDGQLKSAADTVTIEVKEKKTEFDVVLTSVGDNKISVIKEIRLITGLGLQEAQDLVESVPVTVKKGVSKQARSRRYQETVGRSWRNS